MTIGERIRSARQAVGLSQVELAQRVHTTKQNIYKYETGIITNIPSDKVEAIASALDVTASHLMGWDEPVKPNKELGELTVKILKSPLLIQLNKDFILLDSEQQETVLALVHSMIPKNKK